MNSQLASFDQIKNTLLDLAIRFGPKLLVALLVLIAGIAVSRWLLRALGRIELEPPVRSLLARVGWGLSFALFLIMALQNLGVQLLPLIAGLGVAGAGVALATQGVLSNIMAGLSIIFTKPFRVGKILHNYGNIRQLQIAVGVAYDTDLNAAMAVIGEVLRANPRVLPDPAPLIQTILLGDWAVSIGVRPWVHVQDFGPAAGEINQAILQSLRERDIVLPLPQREVRLIGGAA